MNDTNQQDFEARILKALSLFGLYMSQEAPASSAGILSLLNNLDKLEAELDSLDIDMDAAQYVSKYEEQRIDSINMQRLSYLVNERSSDLEVLLDSLQPCPHCGRQKS